MARRFQHPKGIYWEYAGGDWSIRAGVSRFLIAKGPGWSVAIGRKLFEELRNAKRR